MTAREFLDEKLAELRAIYDGFMRLSVSTTNVPEDNWRHVGTWHLTLNEEPRDIRVCNTWDEVLREVRAYATQRTLDPIYLGM